MIEIQGVNELAALSRRLKDLGDKELKKEFSKSIREAVKPFKDEVRKSALDTLPERGGLAELSAKRVVPRTRRSNSAKATGIRLVALGKKGMKDIARMDKGTVRHPVHADPNKTRAEWVWVDQNIDPGFWTKAVVATGPGVYRALVAAMDEMTKKLDGRQ